MIPALVIACLLTANVLADVIDYDKVKGFEKSVPDNSVGFMITEYQPYLDVRSGCVSFPAVDIDGNIGGGMKPGTRGSMGCKESIGQVYTRTGHINDLFAIMYSWYFPKDGTVPNGRRHGWENTVLFFTSDEIEGHLVSKVYTSFGKYHKYYGGRTTGHHPHLEYFHIWPKNHELGPGRSEGQMQPLINWEQMTDAAREALNTYDYGKIHVPFNDEHWNESLADACAVH